MKKHSDPKPGEAEAASKRQRFGNGAYPLGKTTGF